MVQGRGRLRLRGQPSPCQALAGLSALGDAYAPQVAAYHERFPDLPPLADDFVAATDTFARGWMTTFSALARKYRIYLVGSGKQARFRKTTDPADIAAVRRPRRAAPDLRFRGYRAGGLQRGLHVGPARRAILRLANRKVPLTPIEQALQLTPGPSTGPEAVANLRPYRLPGRARASFATSLPAFIYGDPPAGTDPRRTQPYYMRCLDKLGANLVIQDEANPGAWTGPDGDGSSSGSRCRG